MGTTQKRIQLLAISPERGVAYARYKNNLDLLERFYEKQQLSMSKH